MVDNISIVVTLILTNKQRRLIMLKATARSYRKRGEIYEQWQCPNCGKKQEYFLTSNDTTIEDCCKCNKKIEITYRKRLTKRNI